jgi:predicted TIM-barrel fold metal-dependent hydrolase
MNIDCDTHYTPREFYSDLPTEMKDCWRLVTGPGGLEQLYFPPTESYRELRPGEYDLELRKQAMREAGFDKQCLMKAVGSILVEPGLVRLETIHYLLKRWNDLTAKVIEQDDSFIGIAQIPHHDPALAIEEAERAVKDLGFKAIEFNGTWIGKNNSNGGWVGKNIEDREWWPFFEAIERLRVPLWYHGNTPSTGSTKTRAWAHASMIGLEEYDRLPYLFGPLTSWLWQAQLITLGMVFSGLLDKYPGIKIAMTEVDASWVPSFMAHMDYEQNHTAMLRIVPKSADGSKPKGYAFHMKEGPGIRKKASSYMKDHFYFAINNDSPYELEVMLPVLMNKTDLQDNVMAMTDYDHTEGTLKILNRIRSVPDVSEDAKNKVCGENAARLLNIH